MKAGEWQAARRLLRLGAGLAGARPGEDPLPAAAVPFLCRLAAREGLAPFLVRAAEQGGLDSWEPAQEPLRELARRQQDHRVRVQVAAAQAIRLLRQWEIPALAVKGLVVARAWPEPMLRGMSDVDLVVPWEERFRLWRHHEELERIRERTGVTTEVEPCHHDLTAGGTIPFSFPALFARARPVELAGEECRGAGWEESLLFTAASALRKDLRSLRLQLDTLFLARRPEVDPRRVLARAERLGLAGALLLLFRQAEINLGAPNPLAGAGRRPPRAAARLLALHRDGGPPPRHALPAAGPSRWLLRLLSEPPLRAARRSMDSLFPPPLALRNQQARYGMEKRPLPLLYLRHWGAFLRKLISAP